MMDGGGWMMREISCYWGIKAVGHEGLAHEAREGGGKIYGEVLRHVVVS